MNSVQTPPQGGPGSPRPSSSWQPPSPLASLRSVVAILAWQALAGLLLATALWPWRGPVAAYSALLGVATCVLPNALFALRILTGLLRPALAAKSIMRGFYLAELVKLAATIVLFAAVFRFVRPLAPAAVFAGFIFAQVAFAWAAWRVTRAEAGADGGER